MRGLRTFLLAVPVLLASACADFEGTSYEQVVQPRDVEFEDRLPEGYFIIGEVTSLVQRTTEGYGSDPCNGIIFDLETRAKRRMRREAAYNGGELLIGFSCDEWLSDGEDWEGNYEQTCEMECWAEVARGLDRPGA